MFLISLGKVDIEHENFIHSLNFAAKTASGTNGNSSWFCESLPSTRNRNTLRLFCSNNSSLIGYINHNHVNAEHEEVTISKFERQDRE